MAHLATAGYRLKTSSRGARRPAHSEGARRLLEYQAAWRDRSNRGGKANSSLEGNTRRAIDLHEGDKIDEPALQALIRAAVALNAAKRATARPARSQKSPTRA